jgi:PAS domain S-box-containing protein
MSLRIPLSRKEIPAVKGLLGDAGASAGPDYRGVPVYAVSQPVTESPWLVVAKIDRSEAEAHLVGETILVAALGGGLSLAAVMTFLFFQRRRLARHYSELYEAESERRLLADTIAASLNEIYLFDAETYRFRFVNAGALQNLGYTLAEIRNLTPLELKPEFSKADFEELAGPLKRGETALQQFETVHRRKDGSRYPVEVRLQLIARGEEKVFLAVILDIGEKRLLEEQLREAQRLESIGRLAGGVAHDFNNYLTVINGFSDLMLPAFEPADPCYNRLLMIRHAGEQAANLTRQLLAFSRRQVLEIQPVCLNSVIRSIRPLVRRLVREDLELAEALADDLGLVPADAAQMGQVVMNLVLNGRDAIPGAGRILIETANVELGAAQVAKRPGVEAGAYVMLAVTDTGEGMRAEVMSRVFEPFYTTKEQGHGTGLGLAAVHGIVRQCGGWIWVYSEPGKGSTFKVYLPRTGGSAAGRTAAAPLAASLFGTETILVVEDQDEVREITCAVLREHGYRVLRASHGEDALQVASGFPGAIDLLVTDVVMPGMNGRELARALAGIRPEMKVIYVSGYTSNVVAHHGVLEPGVHYLPKPFAPQALATMVRAVLSGGES